MTDLTHSETPDRPGKKLTGKHVLLYMLAFFGVMFAVNGLFLYKAITSFPGEDVKNSYLQGLNYNDTLSANAAQAALGWSAAAGIDDGQLVFHLTDRAGEPLSIYQVSASLQHPTSDNGDAMLELESVGNGRYRHTLNSVPAGRWNVTFEVTDPTDKEVVFLAQKEISIR